MALQKRWSVGSSTIVPNAMIRGSLQARYWFWTPGCPQHASRDFDDAWSWCVKQGEAAGLPMAASSAELESRALADLSRGRELTRGAVP